MVELLNQARIGLSFIKLVKDPYRTEEIFKIAEIAKRSKDQSGIKAILACAMECPGYSELSRLRYRPSMQSIDELSHYPSGSLGRVYADHMLKYSFKPDFFPGIDVQSDADYLKLRMRETHDIWHVLTGFDASILGELALQGFMLAQLNDGMSALLVSAGLLHSIKAKSASIVKTMDVAFEGYQLGKRAVPLIGIKWEEVWEKNLDELQVEFGLSRA